jgi:hypothetical protein
MAWSTHASSSSTKTIASSPSGGPKGTDPGSSIAYDRNGKLLTYWGVYGTYPGASQQLHQFSVDYEGNLYTADSFVGRVQKFTPKANGDKTRMIPATVALPRQ